MKHRFNQGQGQVQELGFAQRLAERLGARFLCARTREQLEALADGELEPRQKALVQHHVARCSGCRAQAQASALSLSETREALAQHPRIAAPAGFDARVWELIEQRAPSQPATMSARLGAWALRPVPRLLGSAFFGLAVALALGGLASSTLPPAPTAVLVLPAPSDDSP